MNIRISEKQVRFRITEEELATLERAQTLTLQSPLGVGMKQYVIEISDESESLVPNKSSSLALREKNGNLVLLVSKNSLTELHGKLPSKDGIEDEISVNGQLVKLALEVDVKRK